MLKVEGWEALRRVRLACMCQDGAVTMHTHTLMDRSF